MIYSSATPAQWRPSRPFVLPLAFLVYFLDDCDDRDTAEPFLEQVEGVALRHDHQETGEGTDEGCVLLWLQQLQSEEGEDGGLEQLHEFVCLPQEVCCDLNLAEATD